MYRYCIIPPTKLEDTVSSVLVLVMLVSYERATVSQLFGGLLSTCWPSLCTFRAGVENWDLLLAFKRTLSEMYVNTGDWEQMSRRLLGLLSTSLWPFYRWEGRGPLRREDKHRDKKQTFTAQAKVSKSADKTLVNRTNKSKEVGVVGTLLRWRRDGTRMKEHSLHSRKTNGKDTRVGNTLQEDKDTTKTLPK